MYIINTIYYIINSFSFVMFFLRWGGGGLYQCFFLEKNVLEEKWGWISLAVFVNKDQLFVGAKSLTNKEKARQPNILIDKQTKLMAIRQTKRRKYTL